MKTNQQIRQELFAKRDALPKSQTLQAASQATKHLINSELFLASEHIACYLPVRSEFSSCELIAKIWQAGKKCYLPVVDKMRPGFMNFILYKDGDVLIKNQFGISEPSIQGKRIPGWALNLVVLPLVGFDDKGNRLGSGCGFYDRMFAGVKTWGHAPTLCGFAHSSQQTKFNIESWDVPMDALVTEVALKTFF